MKTKNSELSAWLQTRPQNQSQSQLVKNKLSTKEEQSVETSMTRPATVGKFELQETDQMPSFTNGETYTDMGDN